MTQAAALAYPLTPAEKYELSCRWEIDNVIEKRGFAGEKAAGIVRLARDAYLEGREQRSASFTIDPDDPVSQMQGKLYMYGYHVANLKWPFDDDGKDFFVVT